MGAQILYLAGDKIPGTRLTYIQDIARTNPRERRALFKCDCGESVETTIAWVRHLNVTSCGCLKRESLVEKNTTHGHASRNIKSGAYRTYAAMLQRLRSDPHYEHIKITERWLGKQGFANFLADMGERPDGQTIERVNGAGDYEPANCIWATRLTQAQNLKQTSKITINGVTHSINEWCRIMGISYQRVKQRRNRMGMTTEQALTTPLNASKQGRSKSG